MSPTAAIETTPAGMSLGVVFFVTTGVFVGAAAGASATLAETGFGAPSTSSEKTNPASTTTAPALRTSASGLTTEAGYRREMTRERSCVRATSAPAPDVRAAALRTL